MHILVLNNYSINRVYKEVKLGLKPSHHLYGVYELKCDSNFQVHIQEKISSGFWYVIGIIISKIPLCNLGDLATQIQVFKKRKEYDIVYAPCQDMTLLLGLLAYLKIFKPKIIALVHHPFLRGKLKGIRKKSLYFSLSGHYLLPALSLQVSHQITSILKKNISPIWFWGPDDEYFKNAAKRDNNIYKYDVVAIGRTARDNLTFLKAYQNTTIRASLYCHISEKNILGEGWSNNISIHYLHHEEALDYKEIIEIYSNTKIIVIPLLSTNSLAGLTSITDALAMRKPCLVTFNKFININIEDLEIGYWIKQGNAEDLQKKTITLLESQNIYQKIIGNTWKVIEVYNSISFYQNLVNTLQNCKSV